MRKYGESKTTRIIMATVPHVTSGSGLKKFLADGFLFDRVYLHICKPITHTINGRELINIYHLNMKYELKLQSSTLLSVVQYTQQLTWNPIWCNNLYSKYSYLLLWRLNLHRCASIRNRTRVGTLIVATIYLQLIQNRYMFRSFIVLQCSHQHCVQPVASDVEVVGYL